MYYQKVLVKRELIDTCWDVNRRDIAKIVSKLARINRYMLGCKYGIIHTALKLQCRINRYMLGCKYHIAKPLLCDFLELIDTCWDVNKSERPHKMATCTELIDTCWDVNMYEGLDEHSPSKN